MDIMTDFGSVVVGSSPAGSTRLQKHAFMQISERGAGRSDVSTAGETANRGRVKYP